MQREKASKTNKTHKNGKKQLNSNNETTTAAAEPVATKRKRLFFEIPNAD